MCTLKSNSSWKRLTVSGSGGKLSELLLDKNQHYFYAERKQGWKELRGPCYAPRCVRGGFEELWRGKNVAIALSLMLPSRPVIKYKTPLSLALPLVSVVTPMSRKSSWSSPLPHILDFSFYSFETLAENKQ